MRLLLLLSGVCAATLVPDAARAQPTSVDRVENLLANGVIGGVTASVRAIIAGKPVDRALTVGFVGGVLHGVGKQVAASDFDGAGVSGRQLSSLGLAVAQMAVRDTFLVPIMIGPLTLELAPNSADRVRPRLNLTQTVVMAYYAAQRRTSLDVAATLSTGAPTFRRPEVGVSTPWGLALGHMAAGTILLGAPAGEISERTMRHESLHVLQLDFANELIGFPLERTILQRIPGGKRLVRHIDLGIMSHLLGLGLASVIGYDNQPWEREAYHLAGPWSGDVIDRR